MLQIGHRLGDRYRLVDRIGAGGMGEVWRGVDEVLGRPVAVKAMLPAVAGDPDFARRFLAEATAMARVNHPAVASIHDYGRSHDVAYLVMEFVEGESLAQALARSGRLGPATTMRVIAQAADGLQAIHEQGIVHRDIKPANLLIRRDGAILITDFGIARHDDASRLTASGAILGTPSYLSPEQVLGQPATARSDVYSLGLTAYECLAGQRPFEGDNPYAVALQRLQSAPRTIGIHLPAPILRVVERALATDPAHRWPTAAALAHAARSAVSPSSPYAATGPAPAPAFPRDAAPRTGSLAPPGPAPWPTPGSTTPSGGGGPASWATPDSPAPSSGGVGSGPAWATPGSPAPSSGGVGSDRAWATPGSPAPPGGGPGSWATPGPAAADSGPAFDPWAATFPVPAPSAGANPAHAPGPARSPDDPAAGRVRRSGRGRRLLVAVAALVVIGGAAGWGVSKFGGGPGTGAAKADTPTGAAPAGGAGRLGTPTGSVPLRECGNGLCPTEPLCWGGMTAINGQAHPPSRIDCAQEHSWETFVAIPMPAGAVAARQDSLMSRADIAKACSAAVMAAQSRDAAAIRSWRRDAWPITLPGSDGPLLHCLAAPALGDTTGAAFKTS
ncbi:serine/threonine-protein kinase [Paractinoplanes brasiliensis]|uniref:non-specific serine/threonine protein kinase n=1 Tax=Paractinoplanes brasiliensis TaxID=52695 RepID=A0A4R6JJT1_9ACTN|nr:serine/threonine-protein kinase [Actinoplanes brasiliensis]TDO36473.1 serine/threonine protein kinase [Actinoplanes brasiliensis]